MELNRTLKPIQRKDANLEAEKGETVVTNLQGEGIPEFYRVNGKPHSKGGTPLNLPNNSFFFSKFHKMKIKDEDLLNHFGVSKRKGGYTPAEISTKYDLNKYREILADPDSTKLERHTAELMIKNYMNKLGALALAQESHKNYDNGIPMIAMPYIQNMGFQPEDFINISNKVQKNAMEESRQPIEQPVEQPTSMAPTFKYGGELKQFKEGGENLEQYQTRGQVKYYTASQLPKDKDSYKVFYSNDAAIKAMSQNPDDFTNKKVFIKTAQGYRPIKLTSTGVRHYKAGELMGDMYGDYRVEDLGDYTDSYYQMFNNLYMNDDLRKKFYENYKKRNRNNPDFLNEDGSIDYDTFVTVYLDFLKDRFKWNIDNGDILDSELRVAEPGSKAANGKELWKINTSKFSEDWINEYNKRHPEDAPINTEDIKAFQDMDAAMAQIVGTDLGDKYKLTDNSFGVKTDANSIAGSDFDSRVSISDGLVGDRTLTRLHGMKPNDYIVEDDEYTPEEDAEEPEDEEKPITDPGVEGEYFKQDLNNVDLALGTLFGRNRYYPKKAFIPYVDAIPVYDDVRGWHAAAASGAASAAAATPLDQSRSAVNANANAIGLADSIIKGYQSESNRNNSIYNNFALQNAQLKNAHIKDLANADQSYYQGLVTEAQDKDNTRIADLNNLVTTVNNAETNKANAATINKMYGEDYMISPADAGELYFRDKERMLNPNPSSSVAAQIIKLREELLDGGLSEELTDKILAKNFGASLDLSTMQEVDPRQQAIENAMALQGRV